MRDLSQHLIDLIENSVRGGAGSILVEIEENSLTDQMVVRVADDGVGMDRETVTRVTDPFFTSRTSRRVGLGLPLLSAATQRCEGSLEITSVPGQGTTVTARFRRGHIDRPPLGDLEAALLGALVGHSEVNFLCRYRNNDRLFELDGAAIKTALGEVPFSHPSVLRWLNQYISEGLAETAVGATDLEEVSYAEAD